MTFIQAIILGIVEGLTEFLPISSTFHLIFTSKFLGLQDSEFVKVFEVFIQSGAILAVLLLFGKEMIQNWKLTSKILVSFIPTSIVGLALHKVIKGVFFESDALMLGMFAVLGVVFIVYEWWLIKNDACPSKKISDITYPQAALIGLIQAGAVIPGVSRAGAVILGAMWLGVDRKEAAKYSFILALPTIVGAAALDLFQMREVVFAYQSSFFLLGVGFVTAFISAAIVLVWFIKYLQKNSLAPFGWYRLVAVVVLVALMSIGVLK